ncbi:MAG TPA: response regulator transcription factor [Bryobacteraceae bacterium]|jgi:DNA-binding NarL/FixJ family response regulator
METLAQAGSIAQEFVRTEGLLPHRFRIVLADDHLDILREVRALLTPEFEIVNAVTDGLQLIDAVREARPDVVVSDLQMPGLGGMAACRRIIKEGWCNAVVVLTMHNEAQLIDEAIAAKIRGYVLKMDAGDELVRAVRNVLSGSTYCSCGTRRARGR